MRTIARIMFPMLLVSAAAASSRLAEACGGTFCDRGPRFMSVDQTGENIIFVMEPGQVEAHIQIQYRGDAAHFSWVLPIPALPEIEVGSEALFDRLLAATVPRFGYTTQNDACGARGTGAGGAFGPTTSGGLADASVSAADSGVNIVLQTTVGAFDVTVLSGGTSQEVLTWLEANAYQTPPNAAALFDDYVARRFLFVAVKLTGGAGTDQIHPLVVRYTGTSPCVPIKLTAVAATEDMGVRTFFLGTRRVVPRNYKHISPNPVLLDWNRLGTNYTDLVGRAVDSPVANGQAFVTEYAGPAAVVGATPIASPSWNAAAFFSANAVDVVNLLRQQGLAFCNAGFCSYTHPLVLPLLREFLPAPAALPPNTEGGAPPPSDPLRIEGAFYGCLSCYATAIDMTIWNAGAFAAALSSRIIEPARHADNLLAAWPYLTRMFTTISPAEMTLDPEFQEREGLGDVRVSGSGVRRTTCTGATGMTLPDGRQVALTPQSTWPGFSSQMPFAERIEEFAAVGDPIVLVDNTERINSQLKAWNDSQGWPPPVVSSGGGGGPGSSGFGGSPIGGGNGGGAVSQNDAGTGAMGTGGALPALPDASQGHVGCSCRVGQRRGSSRVGLALTALILALVARRRKQDGVA